MQLREFQHRHSLPSGRGKGKANTVAKGAMIGFHQAGDAGAINMAHLLQIHQQGKGTTSPKQSNSILRITGVESMKKSPLRETT
jgi:hypothetical protein